MDSFNYSTVASQAEKFFASAWNVLGTNNPTASQLQKVVMKFIVKAIEREAHPQALYLEFMGHLKRSERGNNFGFVYLSIIHELTRMEEGGAFEDFLTLEEISGIREMNFEQEMEYDARAWEAFKSKRGEKSKPTCHTKTQQERDEEYQNRHKAHVRPQTSRERPTPQTTYNPRGKAPQHKQQTTGCWSRNPKPKPAPKLEKKFWDDPVNDIEDWETEWCAARNREQERIAAINKKYDDLEKEEAAAEEAKKKKPGYRAPKKPAAPRFLDPDYRIHKTDSKKW